MRKKEKLYRLVEDGQRLIGEEFLKGEAEIPDGALDEYVEPMPSGATGDLQTLDSSVERILNGYSETDTAMDGALAEDVHRCLDITRRTAGDPGLWHWIAIDRYPDFVRHRWEYRSEAAMREKFLGAGSDLYSNAIHRLWWIAELTHDESDYTLTETVFSNQTMVNKVFDRWFARHQPTVVAVCGELTDEPSWVIDETTRRFNHALSNIQLEALTESDARDLVTRIIDDVHQ